MLNEYGLPSLKQFNVSSFVIIRNEPFIESTPAPMNTQFLHKVRSILFSPDSRLELFARSLYHRIAATKFSFRLQDISAQRSYKQWRNLQRNCTAPDIALFQQKPLISFILDDSAGSADQLQRTLDSLLAQASDRWEVLIISPNIEQIKGREYDSRIKTFEKPSNLLDQIKGDYLLFCRAGDVFFSSLMSRFYQSLSAGDLPDVAYYDCEVDDDGMKTPKPLFKPSRISPALLLSVNYLSRALIKVESVKSSIGEIQSHADLMAQEYSILLKLCESDVNFKHIPHLLLSQINGSTLSKHSNLQKSLVYHLQKKGLADVFHQPRENGFQLKLKTSLPAVSIIILTKNHYTMLKTLLDSIYAQSYEQEFEIILVDNASDEQKVLNYYKELEHIPNLRVVPFAKPFNYSEANNLGVSHSKYDLVLLLNDDMKVASSDWLSELSQWAMQPDIGVVGAKLLRANHIIQHTGIIMGLVGFVGHIYLNAPEHYHGLWGSADWYRDVIAVTGACQIMRRAVFDQVGGYNSDYRIAFGDIDFCRRVYEKGYRNMVTPYARLYHYEGQTRGYVTPVDDILKGYAEFAPYLLEDDPYFSPHLTYTRIPRCALQKISRSERLDQIEARKSFYLRKS